MQTRPLNNHDYNVQNFASSDFHDLSNIAVRTVAKQYSVKIICIDYIASIIMKYLMLKHWCVYDSSELHQY